MVTTADFMRAYTAVNNSGLSCTRSDISLLVNRLPHRGYCVILSIGKTIQPQAALPLQYSLEGTNALRTRERRDCRCMLHMLTYFSFVSSFAPLWGCATQSLREERNSRHYAHSDGLPMLKSQEENVNRGQSRLYGFPSVYNIAHL